MGSGGLSGGVWFLAKAARIVGIGGFGEVVDGSEAHGVDSGGDASVACQHNDFDGGIEGMDLLKQLKPRTFGELDIRR